MRDKIAQALFISATYPILSTIIAVVIGLLIGWCFMGISLWLVGIVAVVLLGVISIIWLLNEDMKDIE